ncbi:hypothetical protein VN12_10835 [Pirellula sp. SH-Sr6A]|uniref:hypothetical protein n=1 Tax=Pirellula sp. SH-Sr6A TaxID=1632865 RepID=UPI00078D659B|nr:hypothetical protein [Pirellula sp. SH-Sr6A]AMV32611.1 hypothetical protein VN12_10835 [Pirellula sp. SH-Sr6A]
MRMTLILVLLMCFLGLDLRAQEKSSTEPRRIKATVGEIRLAEDVEIEGIKTLDDLRGLNKLGKVVINEKLVFDTVEGKKVSFAFEKAVSRVISTVTRLGKTQSTYDQVPTGTKVTIEINSRENQTHAVGLQYSAVRAGLEPDDKNVPLEFSQITLTADTVVSENMPKFLLSQSSKEPTFIMILVEPIK